MQIGQHLLMFLLSKNLFAFLFCHSYITVSIGRSVGWSGDALVDKTHVAPYGYLALFDENYNKPEPDSNDDEDEDAEIDNVGDDIELISRSRNKRE